MSCSGVCFLPSCALSWVRGCSLMRDGDPAASAAVTLACWFFLKLDRTFFFSFPWKQNSTDQVLNDNDPKQRLIHHRAFKWHFDIIGNVNPGIFIINAVAAFDCSPGRGLLNLKGLYWMFGTWRHAGEEPRQGLVGDRAHHGCSDSTVSLS